MSQMRRKRKGRKTMEITCSSLRFSQANISWVFRDGRSLDQLITELEANPDHAYDFPPLRIFKKGKHYVSLDNRRLACLSESSRFLGVAIKVPCILYSKRFIATSMGNCQARKLKFYCASFHRGAFVQVNDRTSSKRRSRTIRVYERKGMGWDGMGCDEMGREWDVM